MITEEQAITKHSRLSYIVDQIIEINISQTNSVFRFFYFWNKLTIYQPLSLWKIIRKLYCLKTPDLEQWN